MLPMSMNNDFPLHRSFGLLVAVILFVSFLLYWPDPRMGFVLDDHYVIAHNPVIKNPRLYPKIFTGGLFEAAHRAPESKFNYYRPFLVGSFALDYRLWGLNALDYRIVNILLHALNSVLVFIFLWLLFIGLSKTKDVAEVQYNDLFSPEKRPNIDSLNVFNGEKVNKKRELAALASFIFCILPVQEWVVRYIVGRGDLLQTFFSLVSFIALIWQLKENKKIWLALSLAASLGAILSREVAVLNVIYVFMISATLTRDFKKTLSLSLPFFVLGVGYYALRVQFFPIAGDRLMTGLAAGWAHGIFLAIISVSHFFCPALIQAAFPQSLLIAGLLLVWLLGVMFTDLPLAGFGILWVLLVALPLVVTQKIMDRLGPVLSEHFLYFASVGFALLWASALERTRGIFVQRLLFAGSVMYFFSVGLINGHFWQNEEMLLRHVQRLEGQEFTVAYEQIAMRFDDREAVIRRLLEGASSPAGRSLWLKRLGGIYRQRRDYPKAIAALSTAVELNPLNIDALNELGVSYLETGEKQKGFSYLWQSLQVDPQGTDTYRLLGTALYRQGDFSSAIVLFKKAFAADPDQVETSLYLMMAYFFAGDRAAYLESLERTTRRFPDTRLILKFTAQELFARQYYADTVKVLSETKHLFADDPQMLNILHTAQTQVSRLPP